MLDRSRTIENSRYLKIAAEIVSAGVFEVTITGGDPLLVSDLLEVVAVLSDMKLGITVAAASTLFEDNVLDFFREHDVHLQVGIDTLSGSNFEKIRNPPYSLAAHLDGIAHCVAKGVNVKAGFLATPETFNEIYEVAEFCYKSSIKQLTVGFPLFEDEGRAKTPEGFRLSDEQLAHLRSNLDRAVDDFGDKLNIVHGLADGRDLSVCSAQNYMEGCGAMSRSISLLSDGSIVPCPYLRSAEFVIGNIFEASIDEIWHSARANVARARLHEREGRCLCRG